MKTFSSNVFFVKKINNKNIAGKSEKVQRNQDLEKDLVEI